LPGDNGRQEQVTDGRSRRQTAGAGGRSKADRRQEQAADGRSRRQTAGGGRRQEQAADGRNGRQDQDPEKTHLSFSLFLF